MNTTSNYTINNQQVVVKSNRLIETGYKLGKREQYFILYIISRLDSMRQNDFRKYELSFSEIKRILNYDGIKRLANRDAVFDIMNNLNRTPIYWEKNDEHGELEERGQMTWISSLKHNVKKDTFTFNFDPSLKPFLLQLEEYFTKYALHNVKNFSKSHSIRMYEILKVYERQRRVEFTVEKLKFFLGVSNKYGKFYELKRWILDPTKEELKAFTDIRFEYRVAQKHRKTVLSIEFFIYPNVHPQDRLDETKSIETELSEEELLYEKVRNWGITKATFKSYLKKYALKYIKKRIHYVAQQIKLKQQKGERIKNIGGYLNKMMGEPELFEQQHNIVIAEKKIKAKIKNTAQKKKALEEKLKQLRSELFDKEEAIVFQLFKQNRGLKQKAIRNVKANKGQYYHKDLTDAQNFIQVIPFRMAVYHFVKTNFEDDFKAIQNEYHQQIEKTKKQLERIR